MKSKVVLNVFKSQQREDRERLLAGQPLPLTDVCIGCPLALQSSYPLFHQEDQSMPVSGDAAGSEEAESSFILAWVPNEPNRDNSGMLGPDRPEEQGIWLTLPPGGNSPGAGTLDSSAAMVLSCAPTSEW